MLFSCMFLEGIFERQKERKKMIFAALFTPLGVTVKCLSCAGIFTFTVDPFFFAAMRFDNTCCCVSFMCWNFFNWLATVSLIAGDFFIGCNCFHLPAWNLFAE